MEKRVLHVLSFLDEEFVEGQVTNKEGIQRTFCKVWNRMSTSDQSIDLCNRFVDFVTHHIRVKCLVSLPTAKELLTEPVDSSCATDLTVTLNAARHNLNNLNGKILDFSGKAILFNAPSAFISEYTVPVITFDASRELTDEIVPDKDSYQLPECHNSISGIHYWLKVVDSVCSVEREDGHLQPTVILAGTHIDKLHPDIKIARKIAREKILPQLEKALSEKRYAQHLAGFVKKRKGLKNALEKFCFLISNKFPDEEIERLKSTAIEVAASMNEHRPIYILKIEEALLQCKEDAISKSDMFDLVKNCSLPMAKHSPEFEGLLRYLHEKATICISARSNP